MLLEDKIKKEKEILERKKYQYKGDMESSDAYKERYKDEIANLQEEIKEHESVIAWLEELKEYKEHEFDVLKKDGQLLYQQGILDGYDKAINDFTGILKTEYKHYDIDDILDTSKEYSYKNACAKLEEYVDEMAEQIKHNTLDNDYDNHDR